MTKNTKIFASLVTAAILISMIGFAVDIHNTLTYPGSDLRNRVVGARLMLEGIDPYLFKWQPGWAEKFYDPLDKPTELVSKLSVPPTVLVLHAPMAGLAYGQQKVIWLMAQWGAFIGTLLIFLKTSRSRPKSVLMLGVGFLFANSLFWRFHVSSGQIYITYVFLLAIAWFFINRPLKYSSPLSGFFAGITVGLRPSFILLFIPFLIRKKYLFVLGGILGFLSSLTASWLVAGTFIWKRYVLTVLTMTGLIDLEPYLPVAERTLPSPDILYPKIIESFNWNIRNPLERYFSDTSLYLPLKILSIPHERVVLLIGLVITMAALLLYILRYSSKNDKNMNALFLFGVLMSLVVEFFIPIARYPYYDVQMILPLLIIINEADPQYLVSCRRNGFLIAGFLLSMVGFLVVPRALFLSAFLIAFYVVTMAASVVKRNSQKKSYG